VREGHPGRGLLLLPDTSSFVRWCFLSRSPPPFPFPLPSVPPAHLRHRPQCVHVRCEHLGVRCGMPAGPVRPTHVWVSAGGGPPRIVETLNAGSCHGQRDLLCVTLGCDPLRPRPRPRIPARLINWCPGTVPTGSVTQTQISSLVGTRACGATFHQPNTPCIERTTPFPWPPFVSAVLTPSNSFQPAAAMPNPWCIATFF
jgi:hypothetical protein